MNRTHRIREFARLAGVTVRALHHYDRIGLLRPRRTNSGYRLYSDDDLVILEQIVALRFIGLPLRAVKGLLRTSSPELGKALHAQRTVLEQRRQLIDRTILAVREAETALNRTSSPDHTLFTRIIEVIEMQNTNDWQKQYDELVQTKMARLKSMTPEARAELRGQWAALFKDVEEALGDDPASPHVQALVDRWIAILGAFAPEGEPVKPQLVKRFGASTQANGAPPMTAPFDNPRVWDFMQKAITARKEP